MERKTTEPIGMKIRQARLPVGIDQFEKLREGGDIIMWTKRS